MRKLTNCTKIDPSETDKKKRNEMIQEAFKIHQDDIGHLPLHQQALNWGAKKNVDVVQWPTTACRGGSSRSNRKQHR